MSGTKHIEDNQFGLTVSYDITINTALRVYGEVPAIGDAFTAFKGGCRVILIGGPVPLLDVNKEPVGTAVVDRATMVHIDKLSDEELNDCGFETRAEARQRALQDEEFKQSGEIVTIFYARRVENLDTHLS